MKLTYRGVSYDYTPNSTPSMGPTIATGTYRGNATTFHALAEMPPQPSEDLTCRGVDYRSGTAVPPVVAPTPMAVAMEPVAVVEEHPPVAVPETGAPDAVATLARNLFIRHHQRSRKREQGMMVRLAAEVGIPVEDAAAYESHVQGKLPHDFSGYDRSASAMS
jgi:hypothetical protein